MVKPDTSAKLGTQNEDKQNKKQNTNTEQHVSHINCESMVRVQIVLIDWLVFNVRYSHMYSWRGYVALK
jgi:hypothetical protein